MTQVGKMIFDDGVEEGKKIGIHVGISQGEERKLVKQVCGKLRRGKTVEEIAEALEEDAEAVETICAAAALWRPSYDWEKVYETWKKNHSNPNQQLSGSLTNISQPSPAVSSHSSPK